MMLTSPMAIVAVTTLMTLLPVIVRTMGWLLSLHMILKASRPDERPKLLAAFAPISATLHSLSLSANEPDTHHSLPRCLGTEAPPCASHESPPEPDA
jgi:hypothetical protein